MPKIRNAILYIANYVYFTRAIGGLYSFFRCRLPFSQRLLDIRIQRGAAGLDLAGVAGDAQAAAVIQDFVEVPRGAYPGGFGQGILCRPC